MDGDQKANPMKLNDNIIWHIPDKIFKPCQCSGKIRRKHSDLVQVLLPSMFRNTLLKKNPIQLEGRGAAIFGHNANFKWFWKDTGDPEEGNPRRRPKSPRFSSKTAESDRAWAHQAVEI